MQVMAIRVLQEVAENIQNVDFYSIICDEATDVKDVCELAVPLGWVDDKLEAHDEFIGLKNMSNTDTDSIAQKFKDVFIQMYLKLNKCRGSVMTDVRLSLFQKLGSLNKSKGKKTPIALYTHC